jgi:hypothetical protein
MNGSEKIHTNVLAAGLGYYLVIHNPDRVKKPLSGSVKKLSY